MKKENDTLANKKPIELNNLRDVHLDMMINPSNCISPITHPKLVQHQLLEIPEKILMKEQAIDSILTSLESS
jgi:hypothetical protein